MKKKYNIISFKDGDVLATEKTLPYFKKSSEPTLVETVVCTFAEAMDLALAYRAYLILLNRIR